MILEKMQNPIVVLLSTNTFFPHSESHKLRCLLLIVIFISKSVSNIQQVTELFFFVWLWAEAMWMSATGLGVL